MNRSRKVLMSLLIVSAVGSVVALGAFSAFSATTSNDSNNFTAGTVSIADNDASSFMYSLTNQKPGVVTDKCIKVTYGGSLDADVKLYASAVGAGGQYVDLTVTPGTESIPGVFPSCATFVADAGPDLYAGTLKSFADTYTGWATGLVDNPGTVATKWATSNSVVYRFRVSVQDTNAAQGATSGLHSFTWEARNQ